MVTCLPVVNMVQTGQNIRQIRKQCGLTVKDLQDIFGFATPQAIYKWQRGESLPSFDNMYAMACYFNVKIDDILVGNRQEFFCLFIHWNEPSVQGLSYTRRKTLSREVTKSFK